MERTAIDARCAGTVASDECTLILSKQRWISKVKRDPAFEGVMRRQNLPQTQETELTILRKLMGARRGVNYTVPANRQGLRYSNVRWESGSPFSWKSLNLDIQRQLVYGVCYPMNY